MEKELDENMQSANVLGYTTTRVAEENQLLSGPTKSGSAENSGNAASQRSFVQPLIVDETKQYIDGIVPDHDEDDDGHEEAGAKTDTKSKGKKTRGRVKIKMEFIQNKLRRYTTFSKRKTGIMKKVCPSQCFFYMQYYNTCNFYLYYKINFQASGNAIVLKYYKEYPPLT